MGNLGSTCMRDCSRGDEVEQPLVKLIPLLCPSTSTTKMPIERVSSAQEGPNASDSHLELPVNAGQQIFFQNSASSGSNWRLRTQESMGNQAEAAGPGPAVPPVQNWFQVSSLDRTKNVPKESPRFDEVSTMATPREAIGGEFRTPGPTPRLETLTVMPSPRPDEDREPEVSYEGTYLGTMKHGRGRLRMQNYTYEGEFQNDMKHGLGILEWDDGRRYDGGFANNKFDGAAVMQWPDGRRYVGQYQEDRKHGHGTFSWQDGRRYEGQWVSGRRHGVGIYTNAKGFTRRGTWQQDRPIRWEEPQETKDPKVSIAMLRPSSQPEILHDEEEVIEVSTL
mgnify:FL=1